MVRPDFGNSYPWGKPEITDMIVPLLPDNATILDVGAGNGTYREYFGKKFRWVAVELWPPSVEYLREVYDETYEVDIRNFEYKQKYDLIIFGDILEHLSVEDAQHELDRAIQNSTYVLVAVPYMLPQNAIHGNKAERHLQPDLTLDTMMERYPQLKPIHIVTYGIHPIYGYYCNKEID